MRERNRRQAEGKEPPSVGSGGPSLPAIEVRDKTAGVPALPFEQQPSESSKAFAAFCIYLSQGTQRSLAKTAAKLGRRKVLMERWSRKFHWAERVAAHTRHMGLVEREAAEALVRANGVDWAKRQNDQRE